ncbi:hypothetical protein QF048_000202 [Streptomyces sp. W4I9-2]|nr:hypothetical protein [Streptomyces sp. W4I9-2]
MSIVNGRHTVNAEDGAPGPREGDGSAVQGWPPPYLYVAERLGTHGAAPADSFGASSTDGPSASLLTVGAVAFAPLLSDCRSAPGSANLLGLLLPTTALAHRTGAALLVGHGSPQRTIVRPGCRCTHRCPGGPRTDSRRGARSPRAPERGACALLRRNAATRDRSFWLGLMQSLESLAAEAECHERGEGIARGPTPGGAVGAGLGVVWALSAGRPDTAGRLLEPWRFVAGSGMRLEAVWLGRHGAGPGSLHLTVRTRAGPPMAPM